MTTTHELPESEFLYHAPCPSCGSQDNLAVYDDGHGHCFGCGHYVHGDEAPAKKERTRVSKELIPMSDQRFTALSKRALTQQTTEEWKYGIAEYKGQTVHVANYFNDKHQLVAQKIRTKNKDMFFLGDRKDASPLYGLWKWRDAGKKIVITEGEIDALSVSQMQGHKWPVVSVPTGAQGAKKAVAKAMEVLDGFDEVIFMFDMDEPGQEAAVECAQLFPHGKAKIASLPMKDPNELLVEGQGAAIIDAIWGAKTYQPESVSGVDDLYDLAIAMPEMGLSWPWPGLTALTYGVHRKKAYYLGAGVGIGKTNWAKEHQAHLVNVHGLPVGVFMLEEAPGRTLKGIAGKIVGKPFHRPDGGFTQEDLKEAINSIEGKVAVYRHDLNGTEWDDIKPAMIYMVEGLGIKDIFLDNLTVMVAHLSASEANEEINRIAKEVAHLIHKHDFTLYGFSHLNAPKTGPDHEHGGHVHESQFTGSRALMRFGQYMLGIERNKDPELPEEERNLSQVVLLKDRDYGNVGKVPVRYDPRTDQYREAEEDTYGFSDESSEKAQGTDF